MYVVSDYSHKAFEVGDFEQRTPVVSVITDHKLKRQN
jgi:hypothetical protein